MEGQQGSAPQPQKALLRSQAGGIFRKAWQWAGQTPVAANQKLQRAQRNGLYLPSLEKRASSPIDISEYNDQEYLSAALLSLVEPNPP